MYQKSFLYALWRRKVASLNIYIHPVQFLPRCNLIIINFCFGLMNFQSVMATKVTKFQLRILWCAFSKNATFRFFPIFTPVQYSRKWTDFNPSAYIFHLLKHYSTEMSPDICGDRSTAQSKYRSAVADEII